MAQNNTKNKDSELWWQKPLSLFIKLSGWIAFPVVAAVLLGGWLDEIYGTKPWLLLLSIGVAFVLSMFGIVKDTLNYIKSIDKDLKKQDKNIQK